MVNESHKVLVISPTPTHPTNAGNRARILAICELLKSKGHQIDFLYINKEQADAHAMRHYFGDGFHEVLPNKPTAKQQKSYSILVRYWVQLFRILHRALSKTHYLHQQYNKNIDDYYHSDVDQYIQQHLVNKCYTHVIVEYVVYSKAFENFDQRVTKIIDTHDVLTNRYQKYLDANLKPEWYSLWQHEEQKGLNRADIVWAIQEKESRYFSSICNANVKVMPYINNVSYIASENEKTLLFIGSHNSINIDALNHFVVDIMPLLDQNNSDYSVIVAGNIVQKKHLINPHPKLHFYGEYVDQHEVFKLGNIFINPIRTGTGLKIKTIDSLCAGKCIVTYVNGIEGLDNPEAANQYCILVSNPYVFASSLTLLLKSPSTVFKYGNKGMEYISEVFNKIELEPLFQKIVKR